MVRISDIFKIPKSHPAPEEKPKKRPAKEIAPLPPSDSVLPPDAETQKEHTGSQKPDDIYITRAMEETAKDKARSQNLYLMGIQLAKMVLANADKLIAVNLVQVKHWVSEMVDCLIFLDVDLLQLFYEYASDDYLHSHMVNTVIMATEIGSGIGYNSLKLNELGLAAFLHDIGMIKVEEIVKQKERLTEEEYNKIKSHPVYGAEILSKIKDITDPVIYVAREEHERSNGSGYPKGIKENRISEYARIVSIVDAYEALSHDRPYRKKYSPHEAIKELIKNNVLFDSGILKVLLNKVGIYPVSSWLELNSNEIGQVAVNNNENPLRPMVNIIFDGTGRKLSEPRIINLAKQFNLFIKKALSDEDLGRLMGGCLRV